MLKLNTDLSRLEQERVEGCINKNKAVIERCLSGTEVKYSNDLGWHIPYDWLEDESYNRCRSIAEEIRNQADVLLLIGVGGSNQGARAAIKALQKENDSIEIIYVGNSLSGRYLNRVLRYIKNKSVYVNVIAKNSATLEPGIHFRVVRQWMEGRYSREACSKRIIVTGSLNGSVLQTLALDKGYRSLLFPLDVGGRFSVLTPVGLLPIMAAGLDCDEMIRGAQDLRNSSKDLTPGSLPVVQYGATRYLLEKKGFAIEVLSSFDERLTYFTKWWIQLFAESGGKKGKGLFPAGCTYTEDLHSMGQYIQQGKPILAETFIKVEETDERLTVTEETSCSDGFDYLDEKDFSALNDAAYKGTIQAHSQGGIPCMEITVPRLDAYHFGQLFYFFMSGCYISCELNEIHPFNQPGVENYKEAMFHILNPKDASKQSIRLGKVET